MTEPDVYLAELLQFLVYHYLGKTEKPINFVAGTAPVFRGESVDGNILDRVVVESLQYLAQVTCPGLVSLKPAESLSFRPAPVAVRYDGDMYGNIG